MTTIRYTLTDGSELTVEAADGNSLMRVALREDIPGIVGECGGELTCGTCHVYVDKVWRDRVGPASGQEQELIEVMDGVRPESRLACQITVRPDLDGLQCVVSPFQ